jgi:signal peptidase I
MTQRPVVGSMLRRPVIRSMEVQDTKSTREQTLAPRKRSRWLECGVLAVLLALSIFVAAVQGFWVSGDCMRPDLVTGDRLLADKLSYELHPPHRGDVVIFYYPHDPTQIFVKRIIGLPGETVEIRSGEVYIDNQRLPEPYRVYPAHGSMPARTVPSGDYFVLGDNRDVSDDSRYWGYLPRREIIGRAAGRYWPLFGHRQPVLASP